MSAQDENAAKNMIIKIVLAQWDCYTQVTPRRPAFIVDACREAAKFCGVQHLGAINDAIEQLIHEHWIVPTATTALEEHCGVGATRR